MLEVEGLEVSYGRTRAVKGVSLTVAAGEVVTVLGANGAGKTSLLRALQGAVRPSGGRVMLNGRDMTTLTPAARVREGMVLGAAKLLRYRVVPNDGGRAVGRGRVVRGTSEALGLWLSGRRGLEGELTFVEPPPTHV